MHRAVARTDMASASKRSRTEAVECDICCKSMRQDSLRRHKRTHLLSFSNDHDMKGLKAREKGNEKKEKEHVKQQKIKDNAEQNDSSMPTETVKTDRSEDEIENVRLRCVQNHHLYLDKIELGMQVAAVVRNGEVLYESLGDKDREAFDMYRRYLQFRPSIVCKCLYF